MHAQKHSTNNQANTALVIEPLQEPQAIVQVFEACGTLRITIATANHKASTTPK